MQKQEETNSHWRTRKELLQVFWRRFNPQEEKVNPQEEKTNLQEEKIILQDENETQPPGITNRKPLAPQMVKNGSSNTG